MSNRPTIFISSFRNFSVRYILYSGILKRLLQSDLRLVIFVKDGDLDYYREVFTDDRITFEPILYKQAVGFIKGGFLKSLFVLTRKCMHGSRGEMVNHTDQVRLYQFGRELKNHPLNRVLFMLVKMLSGLGRRFAWFRKKFVKLEGYLFPGHLYDSYFEKYRPEVLVVSSLGYMIDPLIMRAAARNNCKVVSIIHNWDNPTSKDYRGAEPDYAICWNQTMQREVEVFHDLPAERLHVGGIAHWDMYFDGSLELGAKDEYLEKHGLSSEGKLVLYATSAFRTFPGTFDVIEQILRANSEGAFSQKINLLVRLHPQYLLFDKKKGALIVERYQQQMDDIVRRFPGMVAFTYPKVTVLNDDIDLPLSEMNTLAESLHHADLLLTEYSTVMIEGAIFDLPVINVGLSRWRDTEKPAYFAEEYTHLRRLLRHGASRNAHSFEELVENINLYLKDPGVDAERRRALVDAEITTNRGRAGREIGEFIHALTQKN